MNVLNLNIKPALVILIAMLVPLLSIAFLQLSGIGAWHLMSEKELFRTYQALEPESRLPLYYLNYLPVSASYYSGGNTGKISGETRDLPPQGFWLAVHKTQGDA